MDTNTGRSEYLKQGWRKIALNKDDHMILKEVLFIPNFLKRIVAVAKLCENGVTIKWDGGSVVLECLRLSCLQTMESRNITTLFPSPGLARTMLWAVVDVEHEA